jgi:uncharacterized flavoprotein (TIGR03862 family)
MASTPFLSFVLALVTFGHSECCCFLVFGMFDHFFNHELSGYDPTLVQREVDVVVIGAGPAGLAAAQTAIGAGCSVVALDAMRSAGRKFLLAGRSGLNLTNAEDEDAFSLRYSGSATDLVHEALRDFPPSALREWSRGLGEPTFVGSSGRVFPESFRATPLLRAWIQQLRDGGAIFETGAGVQGVSIDPQGGFVIGTKTQLLHARSVVLAMGGASWPRTGSTGTWVEALQACGVDVLPFHAANVAVTVAWSHQLLERAEGLPIKNVTVIAGAHRSTGDVVITRNGLEGGPIYAVGPGLRDGQRLTLQLRDPARLGLLMAKLRAARAGDSLGNRLRKLGCDKATVALLLELGARTVANDPERLGELFVSLPVPTAHLGPLDRAISSAGGIHRSSLTPDSMLVRFPGAFAVGEMVDWEAPTGGYLLQGCWSTGCRGGAAAARYVQLL